ncbi:acyltransferase family protein [Alistipes putredinis]|uniref:acyltransferase family protein n=1 Tax=Alistipes putredinis TaxID=28117 RepID=UPI003AEFBED7
MKTSSKPRDLSFDIARVICTLWIVGIWHLMNYIPNQAPAALTTGIGEPVTVTVLSCFMFISGYFLRKYPFNNRADVLIFYRKRFSRFYVLYFLSAVTLLIGGFFTAKSWFSSYPQFILTLCGLTTFSPPQPGTLWFMSMLMFFYVVTPFIQYGKNPKTTILHAAVLLLLMLLWGQVATIDRSVFLYYLMYVLGLHCTPRLIKRFNGHICVLLISLTIWICLTELIPSGWGGGTVLCQNNLLGRWHYFPALSLHPIGKNYPTAQNNSNPGLFVAGVISLPPANIPIRYGYIFLFLPTSHNIYGISANVPPRYFKYLCNSILV